MAWRVAALALWGLIACGSKDPVKELIRDLDRYPEYSLIVDDTRIEGSFFPDYALRFQVLTASGQRVAGRDTVVYRGTPYRLDGSPRRDLLPATKSTSAWSWPPSRWTVAAPATSQAHPPGYQYVGNPQYGFWGGGGFWQFYGQYALMRDLMGGWGVGRGDWEDYRRNRERGRPYYGPDEGRPTHFWVARLADPKDATAILPAPAKPPPGL